MEMKEIKAYVRKSKMEAVVNALAKVDGLSGVSVNTVSGFGRSRGVLRLVDFENHVKIEAVCSDEIKDEVVATILESARTNHRGDGKVFVDTIDEAWRIETGQSLGDQP